MYFRSKLFANYLQEVVKYGVMDKLQLENFLPYHLMVSADLVGQSLAKVYARYGLTVPEWRIMAHLQANQTLTPSELGYLTNMEKARISRALVLMTRKQLINRDVDTSDRRVSHLTLTASGEALFNEVEPAVLHWNAQFVNKLGEDTYLAVLDAMKIIENSCRTGCDFTPLTGK